MKLGLDAALYKAWLDRLVQSKIAIQTALYLQDKKM